MAQGSAKHTRAANEAFELYKRNWHHVDVERLTPEEAEQTFGGGLRMVA